MKKINNLILVVMLVFISGAVLGQGTTTGGMNGRVLDNNGGPMPGANVVVVEKETGTQYGTITDDKGYFHIPNMNPGGPYTLNISYVGFATYEEGGIYISLGQTFKKDIKMSTSATTLDAAVVTAQTNAIIDGNRTGTETVVTKEAMDAVPTVGRRVGDFIRLTPQAVATGGGGISILGTNNRYNAISIDGAVSNDVFGLSATGMNGGQAGGSAISMDAIDQIQVQLSPFDVRQSGFAGASINAITKRGKNRFDGTVYFFMQNENLSGKDNWEAVKNAEDPESERKKLSEFSDYIYGLSLGGPIIKDKLFFFFNAEFKREKTPQPFLFSTYQGDTDQEGIDALRSHLLNQYGYETGGYLDNTDELKANKFIGRLDWNINKTHKLMFRYSYVNNEAIQPYSSNNQNIYYYNSGRTFPSKTNSGSLELKSHWNKFANSLLIGYTSVFDDRDPLGSDFPNVRIEDGGADIYVGSEPYSTANQLKQNILTITDNFTFYKGAHTITVGGNFEYYDVYNLFIRKNFGEYRYGSVAQFMNGEDADEYDRSYSMVDNVVGDGSKAAAEFKVYQIGFYVQDEWQAKENFKLTFGLRLDVPIFATDQLENTQFNEETIPLIEDVSDPVSGKNYDLKGAKSGHMPKSQYMFSPRIGFNWDIKNDRQWQLRGGAGLFMSRLPLVWPGGAYTNNGITIGGVDYDGDGIAFRPDVNNQYTYGDFYEGSEIPSGQVDLFAEDYKFPQILRAVLAVDKKLPWNMVGTLEGTYTKTINNILYYNYNQMPADARMTGGPDNRWLIPGDKVDNTYSRVMLGTNTNKGYGYSFTAQLQKSFSNDFQGSVAYTYGSTKSMNDGLSSQNSSQWRYVANINGRNNLQESYSIFDIGHKFMAFIAYKKEYAKNFATGVSLFYTGISGDRYSYTYNNSDEINGEAYDDYALIWIPKDASEINLVDIVEDGEVVLSAEEQWTNLAAFIENDPYLKENKGGYAERYDTRLPFESYLDFKLLQDFYINAGNNRHTLQLSFDIFNLANLLNKEWGAHRYVSYEHYELIDIEGMEEDGTTPMFTYDGGTERDQVWNIADVSSRWRMQIGVRYIFGAPGR